MIIFAELDMMARGGSIALLALWSWLLIRDHWSALPARVAVAMNAAIICHVFSSIPGPIDHRTVPDFLFNVGSVLVPGLFWLFARTWFNDEARVGVRSWAVNLVPVLLVMIQMYHFEAHGAPSFPVGVVLRSAMFAFGAAGLWAAWRGRDNDLVEARRRFRSALVWGVGSLVIVVNATEILMQLGHLPIETRAIIEFGIVALCFGFCAAMFAIGQPDMFATTARPLATSMPAGEASVLGERLRTHMDEYKPHRDETLTIAGLAAQLGEQEYRLRRLINGQLGHRNFAAFLNGYRLAEVKSALSDPSQREVPILTIALDAGFGSLGPFNRAFKDAEGMTPSAYRAGAS